MTFRVEGPMAGAEHEKAKPPLPMRPPRPHPHATQHR